MSRRIPQPFRYRDGWRAQVSLANKTRTTEDFASYDEAKAWIADTLHDAKTAKEPELGGPKATTLAAMLSHYAMSHSAAKTGGEQEIVRINHYLAPAGLPPLAIWTNDKGQREVITLAERNARKRSSAAAQSTAGKRVGGSNPAGYVPKAFQARDATRGANACPRTWALFAELAVKRVSQISRADMRLLHSTMTAEGYAASTIQKEFVLLRHAFNNAQENWSWAGFENPCRGIRLKACNQRFVVFSTQDHELLAAAVAETDNPQFWPLVVLAIETTLRQSSLLKLKWEDIDFENRKIFSNGKGVDAFVPMSLRAREVLQQLPGPRQGRIFTMTGNAVAKAWSRVREKLGRPTLLYRDLRHIAPTLYARAGMNAHQLKDVLGHKTLAQATVYVNLASQDIIEAMDRLSALPATPLPPAGTDWASMQGQNKARRLNSKTEQAPAQPSEAAPAVHEVPVRTLPANVISFAARRQAMQQTAKRPAEQDLDQHRGSGTH